jgi:hypothetical protein
MLAVDNQSEVDEFVRRAESEEPDEYGKSYLIGELIVCGVWGGELDPSDTVIASWMVVDDEIADSEVWLKEDELFHVSAATLARRVRWPQVQVINEVTGELMIEMWLEAGAEPFRATRESPFVTGVFGTETRRQDARGSGARPTNR